LSNEITMETKEIQTPEITTGEVPNTDEIKKHHPVHGDFDRGDIEIVPKREHYAPDGKKYW
jgi:hypothetical protein